MLSEEFQTRLPQWLKDQALPLWTGAGLDPATGTVWEALDHDGAPRADMQRRLRVQVRQAYCFAMSDVSAHRDLALQLFRFAMDHGFDPETGNLAARLAPDASILTAPHDLYDVAFMLLAASALIGAGFDIAADLARLETELAKLKAPRGWYENATRDLPRRQNPHMHMFETSTALFAATGATRFRDMAEECLGLFREVFLAEDCRVLEYFAEDWTPLVGDVQVIEPGHMAEWVYLIDRFEVVCDRPAEVPMGRLYEAVLARRDDSGLLPDRSEPLTETRRMWPQTELLKASVAMARRGETPAQGPAPEQVLSLMWDQYLDTPVPGGWYDKRSTDGALLSDNMPASTFYHILVAFRFYLSGGVSV
ncbi:AGE family epimerase/isomerase [Phaeobacter sp. B1627]|uniref:AGE family epimerase/isomerase n=1 Tax=Phaeobacter sp. B1627 TaxID=2583809 RepID=UPI00111A8729|nr:AGE family epimerase/isomerase [Phaeobacter sp. B1627]TNJ40937.1 mannose-6-phosphate isomerase [Phaeobacter sp. B1627]